MSNAAIVLKNENRGGMRFRSSGGISNNMVTNIKDQLNCTRPMESFTSPDSKVGVVSFPCDFDHMYASMSDGMVSSKDKSEYTHLKEICLQHLDLIQQQSEIIAKQEKQIQSLRLEKERLKQRLQRMDRRSQKVNCDAEDTDSKSRDSNTPTSRRLHSPARSDSNKGPRPRNTRSSSPKEKSRSPVQWSRTSTQRRPSEDGAVSARSECEMRDDSSSTTVSQRSIVKGKRRGGGTGQRQQGKRSVSTCSREPLHEDDHRQGSPVSEEPLLKRPKTELNSEAGVGQSNVVLTTSEPYYTATGSTDSDWTLSELCIEPEPEFDGDELEIPQWRVKTYTSLYSMEGTENLDDEVFLKRHHRLEVDERRRKRWDVQRIREQRHIEKLKQRESSSNNALGGSKGDFQSEDPVCSLWPTPDDAEYLQVADELPVAAFGLPISKFTPCEFSLPWLQIDSNDESECAEPKPMKSRLGSRRRASSSTIRRRRVGRGGGSRASVHHVGRRADGSEKK